MNEREKYTFHIDAYSPETIPMRRLAEYLSKLATLLGNIDSVHFVELGSGSVNIEHVVNYEAAPKVRARLRLVNAPDAPDDLQDSFQQLNTMLRDDNAVGALTRDHENVLRFPGKEIPYPKKLGPFNQTGALDGVLIRIGGKDETVHATLASQDGTVNKCVVSRVMARAMAQHLFGAPLRVVGTGRWVRVEDGAWALLSFRANEFIVLNDISLEDAVSRLRLVTDSMSDRPNDVMGLLAQIRSDDGAH